MTFYRMQEVVVTKLQEIQESGEKKPRKIMKQKGGFIS